MRINSGHLQKALVGVLFVVSYLVIWILGAVVLNRWDFPYHFLVPVPAFFLTFWLLDWVEAEFDVSALSWSWPVVVLLLGLVAFFCANFIYFCNGATDISSANTSCSAEGAKNAMGYLTSQGGISVLGSSISVPVWLDLLTKDAFLYFLLMVLLAWASHFVLVRSVAPVKPSKGRSKSKKTVF